MASPSCRWRPLLRALAEHTPVRWIAGPRSVPTWLEGSAVAIERSEPLAPEIGAVSASTACHEAIEAMRWARELLASGQAELGDIAIAATMPADYDDHFLALSADANLDFHCVHGVKVMATREGQLAAALADILMRGLSQTRMRRLTALLGSQLGPIGMLPEGWTRVLPADAPLASPEAWAQLLARLTPVDWPDGQDHNEALRAIISLLERGTDGATETGEVLLSGRALNVWRRALLAGPAASLDMTLDVLKQDDGLEACVTVAWMPASALAASPRSFVRLLGLNSLRWPRGISEYRLLADHIVPTAELDPLPVASADRRDFHTILAISARHVVPLHAMSETDRLLARPEEFAVVPQAVAAVNCWRDWHIQEVTPHDGLVRADHPVLLAILARTQSASSLRRLLRSPLGYVWQYGMRWRETESGTDPLVLDALALGELVHIVLDHALQCLEAGGGLSAADESRIRGATEAASSEVAGIWEAERLVPPRIIWARTLDDARLLAGNALTMDDAQLADARSYSEVPFGGSEPKSDGETPWDAEAPVEIPDTGFRIAGYIDRLDISGDGRQALVRDYKTGRLPRDEIVLDGGKELQRCLYAFAIRALMGDDIEIAASLLYLRDRVDLQLDDPAATLEEISGHLQTARANLRAGGALMGPDAGGAYDDLAFALPANVANGYRRRKELVVNQRLGEAVWVWEAR